jgi:gephyrin
MSPTTLTVGILVVSTTASKDASTDATTGLLSDLLEANSSAESVTWKVDAVKIVPDDYSEIQSVVKDWADDRKLSLVVTSGGTGFAVSDGTPEVSSFSELRCFGDWELTWRQAVKPLLQKEASGLVYVLHRLLLAPI